MISRPTRSAADVEHAEPKVAGSTRTAVRSLEDERSAGPGRPRPAEEREARRRRSPRGERERDPGSRAFVEDSLTVPPLSTCRRSGRGERDGLRRASDVPPSGAPSASPIRRPARPQTYANGRYSSGIASASLSSSGPGDRARDFLDDFLGAAEPGHTETPRSRAPGPRLRTRAGGRSKPCGRSTARASGRVS